MVQLKKEEGGGKKKSDGDFDVPEQLYLARADEIMRIALLNDG